MSTSAVSRPVPGSGNRSGFTLIELLVVIAIIAILAAILFPVFAQAREKARQSTCLSNEKQIGMAILSYTVDNDSTYPLGGTDSWGAWWPSIIFPYTSSLDIFVCPDGNQGKRPYAFATNPFKPGRGQGIDYAANCSWTTFQTGGKTLFKPLGPMADIQGSTWPGSILAASESDIKRTAETILVAEKHCDEASTGGAGYAFISGVDLAGNSSNFIGSVFDSNPTKSMPGASLYGYTAPNQIPNGTRATTTPYPNGPRGAVTARHQAKSDFLFCDGHVKVMDPVATDPDPVNQPQNNMWDGTRN